MRGTRGLRPRPRGRLDGDRASAGRLPIIARHEDYAVWGRGPRRPAEGPIGLVGYRTFVEASSRVLLRHGLGYSWGYEASALVAELRPVTRYGRRHRAQRRHAAARRNRAGLRRDPEASLPRRRASSKPPRITLGAVRPARSRLRLARSPLGRRLVRRTPVFSKFPPVVADVRLTGPGSRRCRPDRFV